MTGKEKLIERLNEILEDHKRVDNMMISEDRLLEGKILAYENCLKLIEVYLE